MSFEWCGADSVSDFWCSSKSFGNISQKHVCTTTFAMQWKHTRRLCHKNSCAVNQTSSESTQMKLFEVVIMNIIVLGIVVLLHQHKACQQSRNAHDSSFMQNTHNTPQHATNTTYTHTRTRTHTHTFSDAVTHAKTDTSSRPHCLPHATLPLPRMNRWWWWW